MKRRILSLLIILSLLCALLPAVAVTASAATYTGTCGENVTWSLDEETNILRLSGTGNTYNYEDPTLPHRERAPWADYSQKIYSILIDEGITGIGSYLFYDTPYASSVTIPDSVTYIEGGAFEGCQAIQNIHIPVNVDYIGLNAFSRCAGLYEVEIPCSVTFIGDGAFSSCSNLQGIWVSENNEHYSSDTQGVLFDKAKKELLQYPGGKTATSYTVPNGVEFIAYKAFGGTNCTGITLPHTLTEIGPRAFEYSSLNSILLPPSLRFIDQYAFYCAYDLDTVVVLSPDCEIYDYKFSLAHSSTYTELFAPEGSTTQTYAEKYNYTFVPLCEDSCLAGKHATVDGKCILCEEQRFIFGSLDNGITWSINVAERAMAISGEGSIPDFDGIATAPEVLYSDAPWYDYEQLIETVTLTSGITGIGESSFLGCENLQSIDIPDSVTRIGSKAFARCGSLKQIKIPDSVTAIEFQAFLYCTGVESIRIPEGVTSIGNLAFMYCRNLTDVTISATVAKIGYNAFFGCNSLKSVTVLSADCSFYEDPQVLGSPETTVLYGYRGSTTESYAGEYGYTFVAIPEYTLVEGIKIGRSLTLVNDITLNFAVPKSYVESYDSLYMECVLPVYQGEGVFEVQTLKLQPEDRGSIYYFCLDSITALQMNDIIAATLRMSKDGHKYGSETTEYSVVIYAQTMLSNSTVAEGVKTICADLLRYGAAAQTFKNYRTDALADSTMTEEQKTYLSDLNGLTFNTVNETLNDVTEPSVTWLGKTLNLEARVVIRFLVNVDPSVLTNDKFMGNLCLRLTYEDMTGETVTREVFNPVSYGEEPGWFVFDFAGFTAAELRTVVSAAVYSGNRQVSPTLKYNIDTYCNGKTGALGDLCKALIAYSHSAKTHFSS